MNYDDITTRAIVKQLLEKTFDMDYMDYADDLLETIDNLTKELDAIKNSSIYELLHNVVYMTYSETPLLNKILKSQLTFDIEYDTIGCNY